MVKSKNIFWHQGLMTKEEREKKLNQKGVVLWFTGLSGSGKSTIAHQLEYDLWQRGQTAYALDGDNIRHHLNKDLGFSPEDREENIRRIGEVAQLFTDAGIIALTAFISPYRKDRDNARALLNKGEFIEIFVKCPIDVCEERDTKGLYKKARAGEIPEFTGISAPYEEPLNPELIVDTSKLNLEQSINMIIDFLVEKGIIEQ